MATVDYPASLPCPQTGTFTPADRVRRSDLSGLMQFAGRERDFRGQQDVTFTFSANEAAAFNAWWASTLSRGGLWFNATSWPLPPAWSGQAVRRFLSPPQWSALGAGYWRVSASVEVRGRSLPAQTYDPTLLPHRYWRIRNIALRTGNAGFLEMNEIGWFEDNVRVDAIGGPISSVIPPDQLTLLSCLNDGIYTVPQVVWFDFNAVDPDFCITWDLGVPRRVNAGGFATRQTVDQIGECDLEYSDDNATWALKVRITVPYIPENQITPLVYF